MPPHPHQSGNVTTVAIEMEPGWTFFKVANPKPEASRIEFLLRRTIEEWFAERPIFVVKEATAIDDAKKYLLGNQPFHFTSDGGIAAQLLYIDRHRLGFDYLEDYRRGVAAVTAADVQQVARKYIDPKRMVVVAAGAVDAKGQPLGPAPAKP